MCPDLGMGPDILERWAMFALTGASGQLGRLVLRHLREQVPAERIVALTRDPARLAGVAAEGIAVRRADFGDPGSLPGAFAGVERLLIISTDDLASGRRAAQQRGAVEAAVRAGVGYLAYTSFVGADAGSGSPLARDHGLTEAALAESGVPWAALRNNAYAEALPMLLGPALAGDMLVLPEGEGRTSWVARDDCARVAAAVLVGAQLPHGAVDVTGPEALSLGEVAERLAALRGRELAVRRLGDGALVEHFVAAGMAAPMAGRVAGMLAAVGRAGYGAVADTVERVTGRAATPVEVALRPLVEA